MPPTLANGKVCYIEIPAVDIHRSGGRPARTPSPGNATGIIVAITEGEDAMISSVQDQLSAAIRSGDDGAALAILSADESLIRACEDEHRGRRDTAPRRI